MPMYSMFVKAFCYWCKRGKWTERGHSIEEWPHIANPLLHRNSKTALERFNVLHNSFPT
jgi:hypothetical protein